MYRKGKEGYTASCYGQLFQGSGILEQEQGDGETHFLLCALLDKLAFCKVQFLLL